ncbi:NAD(P)-dependent oxidoreductase [Solirubrobacter soli]|uniref:NAD(P)-dependent oxidoreductase n=1 Tax=Solirubrobacter soli TaxID=363832 RepID=UPI0004863B36|nr:NAD(P)-dependent oxidoreductase [Solirubrobacter soli]
MIVAAVADSVRELAVGVGGVELRGVHDRLDDVEFLAPEWGDVPDLASMPALRVVQILSAGSDWIEPSLPPGVVLCNARGTRDIPVAEWVVGAILGAATGLLEGARRVVWEHRVPAEVSGSRIVIVGFGSIGLAAASRLSALGATVVGVGRSRLGELSRLVADADVVVDLVPLTDASRGMFDATVFGAMRDGALFVNAGRGGTVDQDALLAELPRLRAVLDVTDPEPLPTGHPLWTAPGVLSITSHQAGDSFEADTRAAQFAVDQLRAYVAGSPLRNVVPLLS